MGSNESTKGRDKVLTEMLSIIQQQPGIRPKDLNRLLGLEHTAGLRNTLIQRGLVHKERRGTAVHYYPVSTTKGLST